MSARTTAKILEAHMKYCEHKSLLEKHKCYLCNVILKSSEEKFNNVLKLHNINLKLENTCQLCYKNFLNSDSSQCHLNVHESELKYKKSKTSTERSYSCEVCSKIFGYVKEVIKHCTEENQMDVNSIKPYLCNVCKF